MYSRGVAVENDPFLQDLRFAYAATIERFVQLCIPEPDARAHQGAGAKDPGES
jgi:hypothetical protein